jgi:hypothetical protein
MLDVGTSWKWVVSFTLYWQTPITHWIEARVDTKAGLDEVEKRKFFTLPGLELRTSVAQSVASRYTDYAIRAVAFVQNKN